MPTKMLFWSTLGWTLCINFWLGLTCYPHGLEHWVFLEEMLSKLLEEIPLAFRRNMWFQHNGAAGHWTRQVPANYKDRWIERAGCVAWPSRSPGLILLDFFLLGYMKSSTYSSSDDFEEAAAPTRHKPDIFWGTRQFLLCRFRLRIEADDFTFEYLL